MTQNFQFNFDDKQAAAMVPIIEPEQIQKDNQSITSETDGILSNFDSKAEFQIQNNFEIPPGIAAVKSQQSFSPPISAAPQAQQEKQQISEQKLQSQSAKVLEKKKSFLCLSDSPSTSVPLSGQQQVKVTINTQKTVTITNQNGETVSKCPLTFQQQNMLNQTLISQGCSNKSRIIQQQVEDLNTAGCSQQIDTAIKTNISSMAQLVEDKYGNYLMQLLIKYCSLPIFEKLLEILQPKIEYLSFNQYSCRAIQLAVERCGQNNLHQFVSLVFQLLTKTEQLIIKSTNSQFASHILLLCLQNMATQSVQPYIDQLGISFMEVACDQYGCRILEYLYKRVDTEILGTSTSCLHQKLCQQAGYLAGHKFGNYLVQAVLRNKYYQLKGMTIEIQSILCNCFLDLACSKFGSNICECVIQVTAHSFLCELTKELDQQKQIGRLVADQFGNFIVQMIIQKFADNCVECLCQNCITERKQAKKNQEEKPVEADVIVIETVCRKDAFSKLAGVVKGAVINWPNSHVQRCVAKNTNWDLVKEAEEGEFAVLME